MFKGYVPTKNKQSLIKFKGVKKLPTLEEVEECPEYAGVLSPDVVLIDIDDSIQSEKLLKIVEDRELLCRVYQTTKGMHFLFKNNGHFDRCRTGVNLACGIVADIKVGHVNSLEILKFGGVERPIIYDILEDEEYQTAPKYLTPVPCKTDFSNLQEGDGRNQILFEYILTLQSNDFTKEEARESIRIMNDHVLAEPLESREIDTILRDDAFKKESFYKGKTFLFDKFAKFLRSEHHILRINGTLHVYDDGIYKSGHNMLESIMITHLPTLTKSKRAEVLSYLDILVKDDHAPADAKYIAFRNGILDIDTGVLLNFDPSIIITNKIGFDYDPSACDELCDKTLSKLACHDTQVRALLEEAVGYCFYRRNELRKFFILTGDKRNGKSTFLAMVEHLLGRENITSLDLKELSERFKATQLAGKLANIGDDIGDEFIANTAILKKLVSGNPINVERKGQDPFDFTNYAKFLFSANSIPRMGKGKDSAALMSRMIIIPFDASFDRNDPDFDPYIKYKLISDNSIKYLIRVGIEGLKRVLQNQGFTSSVKVEESLREYEISNNPVLSFLEEYPKIENEPVKRVYMNYCSFCSMGGYSAITQNVFTRQIKKYCGVNNVVRKINGKNQRVFIKGGE